ncbi:hypothetical protein AtubIFM56815_002075 [Aspergillus tubingensis]|uniref:Major facilitator superfamily (MFS) profile domain-containing protein n=1 Tax=Aspergillus tubingensis TaxID=5068 RepID=A0A9W6AVX4_ASPTU|nr:hypothetical protein AtubIFM56815_002075 [Aspergillus tubingensis]
MEKNAPPTIERDSRPDQNEEILLERAHAANAADHALTWWKAIFKYRKAVFWACIFSFTLTMQSADATSNKTTSFYGQTQFKERFGTVDNGVLEISAEWQTGIQQAMAVGELIGLAIAGFLADRLGWKPILSGMMVWLTGSLFLFAFAQNLGMMVAAMVLCVRKGRYEDARATLRRIRQKDITDEEIEQSIALIDYTNKMEIQIKESSSYAECFRGKNRWRTEIIAQTWGGNGINVQTVQFLEQAGLPEQGAFDLNLILNSQYLTFGLFCIWLMTKFGRATIFTTGLILSDVFLVVIGVLGCVKQSTAVSNTVGSLLLVSTVIYISTVAPSSYTIIGEVPSSKLRAKMVSLARVAFNVSSLISNVLLPKMLTGGSWNLGAKTAFMFAGTNALIWIWCIFRLPETKDRTFREIDYLFEESGLHPRQWRTARINVFDDDSNGPGIVVGNKEKEFQHVENAL